MQLNTLHRMMDAGAYEEVLAECDSLFADFCLSPRFHFLRGQAAIQTGNAQLADEARALSQECLYWLCELGDGTFESPYQITYLSDISDILGAFRLKKRHQEAVEGPNGRLDVVTLHDGTEIWFDVQNLLN
ncbi:MAG: hypothetical protein KDB27_26275 [Planctomycetales bacterium]|nr:hypothetical protein [Planctomycetales bacterium]